MESKKKISISFRDETSKAPKSEVIDAKKEHAAAADQKKEPAFFEKPPEHQVYQLPQKKKKKHQSPIKHLVISSLTALLISLGLGFLLLRMFVSLTDETTTGKEVVPAATTDTEQAASTDSESINASSLEAYFVQAGVFSTEEKALEWKTKLTAQSVSSVVWHRDGQYFLFVGSGATHSEAATIASEISRRNIETYVKPWVVLNQDGKVEGAVADIVDNLIGHLEQYSLNEMSASDREKMMNTLEEEAPESPLLDSLNNWQETDETNLNWLKVAQALEQMME